MRAHMATSPADGQAALRNPNGAGRRIQVKRRNSCPARSPIGSTMNILLVGAGAQGAPCVAVLARDPRVDRILLGASKPAAAELVRDRLGSAKVTAVGFDARDPHTVVASVRNTLGSVDVVIDLTPSFCSASVMRAALALGAHYVNTAASTEHLAQLIQRQPLDLADDFAAANRTALLGCGASPGIANIICRRYCDELDTVERIEIRAGFHTPAQREMVKTWMPTWSPEQPIIADTRAHILIKGTAAGREKTFHIVTGALFDQAAKALELFATANVAVGYAAATGALQLAEGATKPVSSGRRSWTRRGSLS